MRASKSVGVAVVAVLLGVSALVVADEAATKPSKKSATHHGKLVKPWSELSSLSDDQKAKIEEIHGKANEQIKAIHEKEHDEIVALLSPDQKKELSAAEEADAAAKRTAKPKSTTKPAAEEKSAK